MAPSTDQFLHYIYGKGSAASLMLILVNAVLVSAMLLLACSFCKRSKQVNLIKQRGKRPNSELKRVTMHTDNGIREINGIKNGAISAGNEVNSEEKVERNNTAASTKTAVVRDSVKSNPDKSAPNRMHRVLPPPPGNLQAAPPASELEDPLYESVKEMKEQADNKKGAMSISKTIDTTAPDKQGPPTLERINPLYVSADEIKDFPSNPETTSDVPSGEANEKADSTTRVGTEPLYAVIRKEPSVKKPPPQYPGGERRKVDDSTLHNVVLQEDLGSDNPRVEFIPSMKPPNHPSPSEKLDTILANWNKKTSKPAKLPKDMTVNLSREVPPLVPVKLFNIESDIERHTIQDGTEITKELPTST